MISKITEYSTLIFDCDGVVLDSNKVKTNAFYEAALPYGESAAKDLVEYHIANGGISRYSKFEFFMKQIIPKHRHNLTDPNIDTLLNSYSDQLVAGLNECSIADGLLELRNLTSQSNWLIVSGGDQKELRSLFINRGIADLFNGGIFGSPDNKNKILAREQVRGNIRRNALFIGDSRYDHQASKDANIDFVFTSGWTEFKEWRKYCDQNNIFHVGRIKDLLHNPM